MNRRSKRSRWLIIGAAAVVIAIAVLLFVGYSSGNSPQAPSSTASSNDSTSSSTYSPYTPASASPTPPTATDLQGYIPAEFDGYTWDPSDDDPTAMEAGAVTASSGTFQSDDQALLANLAEWSSVEEAAAFAQQRGEDENPGQTPLVDGDINSGAGHYWYYALDDQTGMIYWYFGTFTGQLRGDPQSVQEFFLGFPR
ncbi:MAG: hypothetical protein GX440_08485 [Propionibacterium sp.]|nr:hypothetical protein [Propionibacterium sp.]